MGKNKRATRKQLEEIVGEMINEIGRLRDTITALDNFFGLYIEWKGDSVAYTQFLEEKFDKTKKERPKILENSNKPIGKRERYKKISTPL